MGWQGDVACSVLCKQQDPVCNPGFQLYVIEGTRTAVLSSRIFFGLNRVRVLHSAKADSTYTFPSR